MTGSQKGGVAERYIADIYRADGYDILELNFRTRFSELDIVAKCGDTVVIAEVKARAEHTFVPLEQCISAGKIKRLRTAAMLYLQEKGLTECVIRFDAAFVILKDNRPIKYKIQQSAFE